MKPKHAQQMQVDCDFTEYMFCDAAAVILGAIGRPRSEVSYTLRAAPIGTLAAELGVLQGLRENNTVHVVEDASYGADEWLLTGVYVDSEGDARVASVWSPGA